jgi:hypothetical protein
LIGGMSSQDDDARRAARAALSELFLDTELDARDFERIAAALKATALPLAQLEAIYFDELAPVLHDNLRVPAGVYSGFDLDWLEVEVARQRRPGKLAALPWLAGLRRYLTTRSTIDDFNRVRRLLAS